MSSRYPKPDPNDPKYSKQARKAYKAKCATCRDTGLWDKVDVVRCPCKQPLNPASPFWPDVHKWL